MNQASRNHLQPGRTNHLVSRKDPQFTLPASRREIEVGLFVCLAVALLAIGLIGSTPAQAYRLIEQTGGAGTYSAGSLVANGSGETVRWIHHVDRFSVNSSGAGDGVSFARTRAAIDWAFRAWQAVPCAETAFTHAGATTARNSPNDGRNTIYWAETGDPEYTPGNAPFLGTNTLAITIITIRDNQTVTDVDIAFNGRDFTWGLDDTATVRDIQDTATHEVGHLFGYHHSEVTTVPTPTMNAFNQPNNGGRTLEVDDRNAHCYLYPSMSGSSSDATGDFNGDGRQDLAIGVPNEAIGSSLGAGAVNVLYGSAAGLTASSNQLWHQNSAGVLGLAESDDRFGTSLASGDFNNDGYDDLAIGVPQESIGSVQTAGAINVLYGSPAGLTQAGDQLWHQNSPDVLGVAEINDLFGSALDSGDLDNDGYDDLVIGVPGESVGALGRSGAVNVLYGSFAGLTTTDNQLWHQNSAGIAGGAERNDVFGSSVTVADFDHDTFDDLAAGVPGESIGSVASGGAVNVIYGSASGLAAAGNQLWHQDVSNIQGKAETNDFFGATVSAGDYDNDGYDDLAAGVPGESIGTAAAAGAVSVIYGSAAGLTSADDQLWHQNSPSVLGLSEATDYFGAALASADFDNDGIDDLAIGVPVESIGSRLGAGAVNVLYGTGAGLSATGNQLWHQDVAGINGGAEMDDAFGSALAAGDFDNDGRIDLAIGVPTEAIGTTFGAGAVAVIYGNVTGLASAGDQIWHQNQPGVRGVAEPNDGFGTSN